MGIGSGGREDVRIATCIVLIDRALPCRLIMG